MVCCIALHCWGFAGRRFGVEQRGRLLAKATPAPHVLHMTATPIPRTLALIDHGDMAQVCAGGAGAGTEGGSTTATDAMECGVGCDGGQQWWHVLQRM